MGFVLKAESDAAVDIEGIVEVEMLAGRIGTERTSRLRHGRNSGLVAASRKLMTYALQPTRL